MTKRDFFKVIIKLFGLTSIITSLFSIFPSFFTYGMYGFDSYTVFSMLVAVIIVLALFVILIFKAGNIIDFLDLDKGFDDDRIEFKNLTTNHLVQIGIIIIGGLLILDNIAAVISHAYFALRIDIAGDIYNEEHKLNWAISGVNLVIGLLLLTNHLGIAKLLNKAR